MLFSGLLSKSMRMRVAAAALSLVALLPLARASAAELKLQVDRDSVYIGEAFMLYARVQGDDASKASIDISRLPPAAIRRFDPEASDFKLSINGRTSRNVYVTHPMAIRPEAPGDYRCGPVTMTLNGKTTTYDGPVVRVVGVDSQDTVRMSVTASRDTIHVEDGFSITLSISVASIPPPLDVVEPIAPSAPPHIDAGFLSQDRIDGLAMPDVTAILNSLVARDSNSSVFTLNEYQARESGFGMFGFGDPFRPVPIRFRIEPEKVESDGGTRWEYKVTLDYVAKREGDYTFGPATFKGKVIVGATKDHEPLAKDIFAVGPAVTVRVVPPPEEGRPEWFIGGVGRSLAAHAEFDANVCKVGDPLSLELQVTGDITLDTLHPPMLSTQPWMSKDFRIYEDDVRSAAIDGGRVFKYRVRPLAAGTLEFPSVKVAYFDIERREYVTVESNPIPIQANPTTQIASESASGEGEDAAGDGFAASNPSRAMPPAITMSPEGSKAESLSPPLSHVVLALCAPPALCLAAWLAMLSRAVFPKLRRWTARLGKRSRALRDIETAGRDGKATALEIAGALSSALRALIGSCCGAKGESLSPDEARACLAHKSYPEETALEARDLLAALDAFMYRPDGAAREDVLPLVARARALAMQLCAKKRRGANPPGGAIAIALLLLCASASGAVDQHSLAFSWEMANNAMAQAKEPEDFRRAAAIYSGMVEAGARNAPLFSNLGSALLQAGDARGAEIAFARAERYSGATPELEAGMRAAHSAAAGSPDSAAPWQRIVFFGHYAISAKSRIWIALAAWGVFWLGALVRMLSLGARSKAGNADGGDVSGNGARAKAGTGGAKAASLSALLLWTGAAVALLAGTSAMVTCLQERSEPGWNLDTAEVEDGR